MNEFMNTFGPLLGVVVGATLTFIGSWLKYRQERSSRWDVDLRDRYVDFFIALDHLRSAYGDLLEIHIRYGNGELDRDEADAEGSSLWERVEKPQRASHEIELITPNAVMKSLNGVTTTLDELREIFSVLPNRKNFDWKPELVLRFEVADANLSLRISALQSALRQHWGIR